MALIRKIPFWLIVIYIPFLFLSYQYLLRDSLVVYDAASHFAQVVYLKEFLWPSFSGFNPFNLLGFDQGILYPSLFHFTAATLGFFIDLELATKLVIVLALLLTPISIYLFTSIFFTDTRAKIFMTGMLLVVFVSLPGYLGASLRGLLQVGLLTSFVSLPFVFLYVWSLLKPRSNWLLSAVLLSVVILTHLIAGIFCLLFFASTIIYKQLSKKSLNGFATQAVVAIGLTAFFTIPFVLNYNLISQSVHVGSMLLPNVILAIALLLTTFFAWRLRAQKLYPLLILATVLNLITIVDAVTLRIFPQGFFFEKIYNLHLYRYQSYLYLLSVLILGYWPTRFLFESMRKPLINRNLILLLPLLVLVLGTIVRQPFVVNNVAVSIEAEDNKNRFIETFSREDAYPFVYTSQNKLVTEESKSWAYGLFTDATPNGPYLGSLITSFEPMHKNNKEEKFVERRALDRGRIYATLDLFAIDGLLFLKPASTTDSKNINTLMMGSGVGKSLVEIPQLEIKNVQSNWDQQVENWWFEKGKIESLLVENAESTKTVATGATIKNLKHNKNWSKFDFEVESQDKVPVLVKFAHLPGWKATQNGQEIKIHRASPHLMMVYANGKVEFEYQKLWYQYLSVVVSLFTFLVVTMLGLRAFLFRNAKN